MDPMLIIMGVAGVLVSGLGWRKLDDIDKRNDKLLERIAELDKVVNALTNEVGRHDERGKSYKENFDAIFELLRTIDGKLDKKVDRSQCVADMQVVVRREHQ